MLTFLPLDEIDAMENWEGAQLNQAKEILAYEVPSLYTARRRQKKQKEASHALFAGGGDSTNMPTVELTAEDFAERDMDIMAVLVRTGLTRRVPMPAAQSSRAASP